MSADDEAALWRSHLDEVAAAHPGQSGFAILRHGRRAFTARVAMADLAQRTLDLQYYIWEADATGRILADHLVRAAARGVRVRVLIDDVNLAGRDAVMAALAAHPNIEIRLFNPFAQRKYRGLGYLTDFERVNHRMHNKLMVMDDSIALIGGRNVGAHYYEADAESNFRDLDVVSVGPVVREVYAVFERFWTGKWSIPIATLHTAPITDQEHQRAVEELRERIAADNYPFPVNPDVARMKRELQRVFDDLVWAHGKIIWEEPRSLYEGAHSRRMNRALYERLSLLESELLIESAYFVPRARGVAAANDLHDRGVRVRVLTNSLAANDVLAAHGGYAKYRKRLIDAGVELYELRPDPGPIRKTTLRGHSKAALHTKAIVFDRQAVFIGSFNLDPRSAGINTEAGVYIDSPELVRQVSEYMDEGVAPQSAYHVIVDDDGELRWIVEIDGERIDYRKDPNSHWWQRLLAEVVQILPVEEQL